MENLLHFLYELFKALHSQLSDQHKKSDSHIQQDLFITREAIRDRLKQTAIVRFIRTGGESRNAPSAVVTGSGVCSCGS